MEDRCLTGKKELATPEAPPTTHFAFNFQPHPVEINNKTRIGWKPVSQFNPLIYIFAMKLQFSK